MSKAANTINPLTEEVKAIDWKNEDSSDFFENIPIEVFRNWAIKGGFENGCDIDLVYPYIANSHSVIEIGAAYGRVIKHLLKKGYAGKIYAVERSKNFCEYLKQHYSDKAEVIHASIQNFNPKDKVDAILWMWSGLGDFAKEEQLSILQHISAWLNPNGILILETILHTLVPKNATVNNKQTFVIFSEYGTFYSYKPSKEEIHEYGEKLGFQYIKHIDYETATQRRRILHLLSRFPI